MDPRTLRLVAEKMRAQNPDPRLSMHIDDYLAARTVRALAEAIDGVSEDLERDIIEENRKAIKDEMYEMSMPAGIPKELCGIEGCCFTPHAKGPHTGELGK